MNLKQLMFLNAAKGGGETLPEHFPTGMLQVGYMGSSGDWHKSTTNNQVATIEPLDTRIKAIIADDDHLFSVYWYTKENEYVSKTNTTTQYSSFDFETYNYVIVIRRKGGANLNVNEASGAVTIGY